MYTECAVPSDTVTEPLFSVTPCAPLHEALEATNATWSSTFRF